MSSRTIDLNGRSGVVVLCESDTDSLILTKRTELMRYHPGQICFPGGNWEPGDKTIADTALRELYEEMGIEATRLTLLKELRVETTLLGAIIHPWLVTVKTIEPYILNYSEVAMLLRIPLKDIRNSQNYQNIMMSQNGYQFETCQFTAHEEFIWGATARIMRQLAT